jgi:hypothetical protein
MPVNETIDLHAALVRRVRIHPRAVVLNMAIPPRFTAEDVAALQSKPRLADRAGDHLGRERLTSEARARLERELSLPLAEVPRLFLPQFGREAIERVGQALSPLWTST